MFPTHVGMNRVLPVSSDMLKNVPHTRGDEPLQKLESGFNKLMFPTHVGMNRPLQRRRELRVHVPHTRGDEPPPAPDGSNVWSCSPHTWG